GSGGALAIGIGDRVLMMENAVYSVISPEGCAAILWKDAAKASDAAACLRLTADDLKEFGLVDEIVAEPEDWRIEMSDGEIVKDEPKFRGIADTLARAIERHLTELEKLEPEALVKERYGKFRKMGAWV